MKWLLWVAFLLGNAAVVYAQDAVSEPAPNAGAPLPEAHAPVPAPAENNAQPTPSVDPTSTQATATTANDAVSTAPTAPAHRRAAPQVGIAPGTPQTGSLVLAPMGEQEQTETPSDGEWRFDFHGFLRAPMRLGFGSGENAAPEAGRGGKLHSPPYVPDGVFTDWRYTNNLPGPWVEMRFVYGTKQVSGNVLVAAYNITDGGYRNLQAQLGINQAFVTLNAEDLFGEHGGIAWNVGVFQNRYGAAGRYDAGKYETYLFGRTHVAGETLTAFYHLNDDLTLTFEHGLGAKLEVAPLVTGLPEPTPAYLPYPGPVQQGTQLVHHAHAMLSVGDALQIGAHYMTTWTDDARLASEVDGRVTVAGADIKLIDSRYGDAYLGYSRLSSDTPLRVGEGLEVLHSIAGWNLRDNYFGQMSTGTGSIDTVLFQYTLSLARLLRYPEPFWGQGPDVQLSAFGMYNHVASKDPMFVGGKDKLKWGAEATYIPLEFLGVSARFDRVQPNLADSTLAFSAISPKLIFRSHFVTHEQLIIQYTHYFYGASVSPGWPAGALDPDKDAFMISAVMWW